MPCWIVTSYDSLLLLSLHIRSNLKSEDWVISSLTTQLGTLIKQMTLMQSLARNYEGRGTKRNSKMSNALQSEQRVTFQSHCMSLICLDLNKNLWGARMALWPPFAKEKTQGQRGGMGFVQGRISSDREERKLQSWWEHIQRKGRRKQQRSTESPMSASQFAFRNERITN